MQGQVIVADQIELQRVWQGNRCVTTATITGTSMLRPASIILFELTEHELSPDTPVYGEGFQMLYQNGGTLGQREAIGHNFDVEHYKIPDRAACQPPMAC